MCQMCDEYENELVRMGLIEDAKKFREERENQHRKPNRVRAAEPPASAAPAVDRAERP